MLFSIPVLVCMLVPGCSGSQNTSDITKAMAEKMNNSLGLEGAVKVPGSPPSGSSGTGSPQIDAKLSTAPDQLYDGLHYAINLSPVFSGEVSGALVQVVGAGEYLKIPRSKVGDLVTLTGLFSWQSDFQSITGKGVPIKIWLYEAIPVVAGIKADGQGMNVGLPMEWKPTVSKSSSLPVPAQEMQDSLSAGGRTGETRSGVLSDTGSGEVPSPELVLEPADGKIFFGVPFLLKARFTASGPRKILIQISEAKTFLEYALLEKEITAGEASFNFTFSGVTGTSHVTLKAVLVADGGTSNASTAKLAVTVRPVAPDGGTDLPDSGLDAGTDAGTDAGVADYAPSSVVGLSIKFDEYTHEVANTWYFLSSTAIMNGHLEFPYTFTKNGISSTTIEFNVGGMDRYSMTWTSATGGTCIEKYESDTSYPCTFQVVESPEDGGQPDAALDAGYDAGMDGGPDAGCMPACTGRCGGPDSCGGTCPTTICPDGETCGGGGVSYVCGKKMAQTAEGLGHSCAISSSRQIQCWGRNNAGQIGDSSFIDRTAPVPLPGNDYVAIVAGYEHTCALNTQGAMLCWGANLNGQLGQGAFSDPMPAPVMVKALQGIPVKSIGAGAYNTCAVTGTGALFCWGKNVNGQIGDGTNVCKAVPTAVNGMGSGVSAAAGGMNHTCAIMESGDVRCWGSNSRGQIGIGSDSTANFLEPQAAVNIGGDRAVSIAANGQPGYAAMGFPDSGHSCASTQTGAVYCWGANGSGQLGNGSNYVDSTSPVVVDGLPIATAVAAGAAHSCALTDNDGTWGMYCWGDNEYGSLGNNAVMQKGLYWEDTKSPVQTAITLSVGSSIGAGGYHSCAVNGAGTTAWCWGLNTWGQLGNTGHGSINAPVSGQTVDQIGGFLAVGGDHVCAVVNPTDVPMVSCWGMNRDYELGSETMNLWPHFDPMIIDGLPGSQSIHAMAAGARHSCIALGNLTSGNSDLKCWGRNGLGQLGNGDDFVHTTPVAVTGFPQGTVDPKGISAGGDHTCTIVTVVGAGRQGWCWGYNSSGQLGINSAESKSNVPVQVLEINGFATPDSIAAGQSHTCAAKQGAGAWCWGDNTFGQLGTGNNISSRVAMSVPNLAGMDVRAVAAGGSHSCAVVGDKGPVKCWGFNGSGQLGDGTTTNSTVPVDVQGLPADRFMQEIVAGYGHTCIITTDDVSYPTVYCWGDNSYGQLGDGTTTNRTIAVPLPEPGNHGMTRIGAGIGFTCDLSGDTVDCWGSDEYGQLGIASIHSVANMCVPQTINL
ncbi:MAG: hypothetical protein WC889_06495 [Myxococcota bacterium]